MNESSPIDVTRMRFFYLSFISLGIFAHTHTHTHKHSIAPVCMSQLQSLINKNAFQHYSFHGHPSIYGYNAIRSIAASFYTKQAGVHLQTKVWDCLTLVDVHQLGI